MELTLIKIGEKIRQRRVEQELKVQDLAQKAGISKGMLSKIENARAVPSLPVLISLLNALDLPINRFFEEVEGAFLQRKVMLKKRDDFFEITRDDLPGFIYRFIHSKTCGNHEFQAMILHLSATEPQERTTTDGYEFHYLLKGKASFLIGEEVFEMNEGDSIFFDGRLPHIPVNLNKKTEALLLTVHLLNTE